jgi:hypothetical protein
VAFYSELPSPPTIGFYLKFYTSENEKIKCFSGTDEEILADLLILLFQLQNSPGAKAAGVASFISIMIKDCYPAAMQHAFASGLKWSQKQYKTTMKIS